MSREARNQRRAAERKAQKLERKRLAAANHALPQSGQFVSQPAPLHEKPEIYPIDPELLDECTMEELQQAATVRARNPRRIGLDPLTGARTAPVRSAQFVSQSPLAPEKPGHSTGPRTPEGKLASCRNSLKHGLASATLIIPGEDPAEFDALLHALSEDHRPANSTEQLLIEQMAQSHWLTQRALRLQNECFTEEGLDEKRLALLLRYQTTHERAFYRALNSLTRLKKDRSRPTPEFVSQKHVAPSRAPQFVSKNASESDDEPEFVPQNDCEAHSPEASQSAA